MRQSHDSLETFYSRIREAGALCKFKDLEEDVVKDLFIANMTSTSIQMDLLSEVRTRQQVLNFAINRERGQANQQEMLKAHTNNTSWSQVSYIRNRPRPPTPQRILQQPRPPTPTTGKIEPCYKCGQPFVKNHLNICSAQIFTCKICKKDWLFYIIMQGTNARTEETKLHKRHQKHHIPTEHTSNKKSTTHKRTTTKRREEAKEETVDAEAASNIKEIMEDWSSVNIIRPTAFKEISNVSLNKETGGEFWVKTNFSNMEIDWLADTGSPRSFMQESKTKDIVRKHPSNKISTFNKKTRYKCFNNQDTQITGVQHLILKSGSWTANNCNIILVRKLPQNVMGRDFNN